MIGTLFIREMKASYKLLLIFMGVLTLYGSIIISMFDPKLGESLALMASSMPQLFAAFGMMNPGATLLEFLVNYLYGFLLIVFPLVFTVLLSNRLVARYVDRGSMAYLLATPHKRSHIIFTQMMVFLTNLFLLTTYVTILCIVMSQLLFPDSLLIWEFVKVNIGLFGLHLFLGGLCFFFSCIFNESKLATGMGAGFAIAFVMIQMLSQIGDKFEYLRYLTPLTLFNPLEIISSNQNGFLMCFFLYAIGLLLFGFGIVIFKKRDIPV